MTKHWLDGAYKSGNVIFMNRLRFERNVAGFCFPSKMNDEDYMILSHNLSRVIDFLYLDLVHTKIAELTDKQRQALVEQYIISSELVANSAHAELYITSDGKTSISLFEKNHIALSTISGNSTLSAMYKELSKVDEAMLKLYPAAFDERFMFLNANPKNAGIGVQISSLLHLPALVYTGRLDEVLTRTRSDSIKINNAYKIGNRASGDLFMLSFDKELETNAQNAVEAVELATKELVKEEILCRNALKEDGEIFVKDAIFKALGIIKYAEVLTLEDALDALSKVKLGMDMKYLKACSAVPVEELMIRSMPSSLSEQFDGLGSKLDRDIKRAQYIREALEEV